jgi:hypothetical protein
VFENFKIHIFRVLLRVEQANGKIGKKNNIFRRKGMYITGAAGPSWT